MGTEDPLSLLHRWCFVPVECAGFIRWRWEARNHRNDIVLASRCDFDTFTECTADAQAAGYVPPEKRPF